VPVLLQHPVERLIVVEPDAAAFAFLLERLPEADRAAGIAAADADAKPGRECDTRAVTAYLARCEIAIMAA